ncbi:MAG: O-antigen polymerase [Atribacterota bacterium]
MPALLNHNWLYNSNTYSREYYNFIMFSALMGIILFDVVYRFFIKNTDINKKIKHIIKNNDDYKNINSYAIVWFILYLIIFVSMNSRYVIRGFGFQSENINALENIFEKSLSWLHYTTWTFVVLGFLRKLKEKKYILNMYFYFLILLFLMMMTYSNRRLAVYSFVIVLFSYLFIYKKNFIKIKLVILSIFVLIFSYLIITSVKIVKNKDLRAKIAYNTNTSFITRAKLVFNSKYFLNWQEIKRALSIDFSYRLAGAEWPAAIESSHTQYKTNFMYGNATLFSGSKFIPKILWPSKPQEDPEGKVNKHFELFDLNDQLSSSLGFMWADGGIFGIIIGFPLLALLLILIQRLIFISTDAFIIYFGTLGCLMEFEGMSVLSYPLFWLRWVAIVIVINTLIDYLSSIIINKNRNIKNENS